jgi:hypothetical protein
MRTVKTTRLFAALGATGVLVLGCILIGIPAAQASPTQVVNIHCNPADPTCVPSPALSGPAPGWVDVGSTCPAWIADGVWMLNYTGGNSVQHFTTNKNGDWGGMTATGPAELTAPDGTLAYTGHLTQWYGAGQNSNPGGQPTQQSATGFTLTFNGSGPAGTISIHANTHQTTNNAGTTTASTLSGRVTCS